MATANIPVIDIASGKPEAEIARELVDAAVEYGFIYVKGGDVNAERAFELVSFPQIPLPCHLHHSQLPCSGAVYGVFSPSRVELGCGEDGDGVEYGRSALDREQKNTGKIWEGTGLTVNSRNTSLRRRKRKRSRGVPFRRTTEDGVASAPRLWTPRRKRYMSLVLCQLYFSPK